MKGQVEKPDRNIVNMDTLEALRGFQEAGEPDFVTDLIDAFIEDSQLRLKDLRKFIVGKDMVEAAKAAHAVKGSSGNLGAEGLSHLLLDMEMAAKASKVDATMELLPKVEREYQEVTRVLKGERKP